MTLTLTQGIGYAGKRGQRAYVAAITGTDPTYDLGRDFLDPSTVERDHFGRSRYTRTYTYDLAPGVYEVSEHGERWHIAIWTAPGSETKRTTLTADRVQQIARLMDDGLTAEAARLATRPTRQTVTA